MARIYARKARVEVQDFVSRDAVCGRRRVRVRGKSRGHRAFLAKVSAQASTKSSKGTSESPPLLQDIPKILDDNVILIQYTTILI